MRMQSAVHLRVGNGSEVFRLVFCEVSYAKLRLEKGIYTIVFMAKMLH